MRLRTVGKALLYSLASVVLLLAVLLLAAKLMLDRAPRYNAEIKDWVHRQTGYHVGFVSVSPALRLNGPELYFKGLELRSKDDSRVLARATGGRVALDVGEFVRTGRLLAGSIEVDGADVTVERTAPGRVSIGGEIEFGGEHHDWSTLQIGELPLGRVLVRNATLRLTAWNETLPELTFQHVDLQLRRNDDGATLDLKAQFPPILGGVITAHLGLSGRGRIAAANWRGAMQARDVAFPGWRYVLPEFLGNLDAGSGAIELSGSGHGITFDAAKLKIHAAGVATRLPDGLVASFDQIGGEFDLRHADEIWTLRGTHVRASPHDPESTVEVRWGAAQAGALDVRVQASYLRAETLLPFVTFLPKGEMRERVLAFAPTGEWTGTHFAMARAAADAPLQFEIRASFHDAGFAPVGRAPGLRGLNGSIAGDQSGGHVFVDTTAATYSWPAQFAAPIELKKITARMYWTRTSDGLLAASNDWEFATQDAVMHGKLAWQQPAEGGSPVVTLVSRIDGGEIAAAKKYFPRALLPPPALKWLDHAFTAGHVTHADILIRGPIRHFPFRDGSGLFLARTAVDNMTLDYSDGWPVAEKVDAEAEFRNEGVTVRWLGGRMDAVAIDAGEARFVDFKTGELKLTLLGKGDAAAAISYLRATPLDALAEHLFASVEASGPMQVNVDLTLPFKDLAQRRVLVHSHLDGVSVTRAGWQQKATELRGDFDIDGAHVARADLQGQVLGGAFQLTARTPRARPLLRTQLELRGAVRADAMREAFALPPMAGLSGQTEWRGVLKIANEPVRERSLHITSSLTGLELRLPAPLDKRSEDALPSSLDIQWPALGGPQGRFVLGAIVNGVYSLESDAAAMRLARLSVLLGDEPAGSGDAQQIVSVRGNAARVDLAGWLKFATPGKDGRPLSYWLHHAQLQVGELDYLGLAFRDLAIALDVTDASTHIELGGPNVNGVIAIPAASADPWTLQFQKVKFDGAEVTAAPAGTAADGISPRSVPALDFHALQLIWGNRHFGEVKASLRKLEDGIGLQSLAVAAPSLTVEATGEWRGKDPGLSRIQGSLTSSDVEDTLKALGYADVLQARSGKIDFDLNWSGAPSAEALSQVGGHVQLAFDKGQLTGVSPGAGRVLGLASIAALPRRLSLDFSDLTDKGLAFDTVRGSFDLSAGNAFTDDVLLVGPAAEIGLIGRIGLKNMDYDQTAVVTGSVSTALPLAAFVGGPVVGAAVLLFTQVFKEPLKGLARGYYRITGSGDNPTVERIKNADAAAASAEVPR